jgi:ParB-like chromosome segregation protein Spo0J
MYKDRIKELRRVKASELIPSPHNWRRHPQYQQDALRGILDEVGYADAVLVRETDKGLEVIDGHLRTSLDGDQTLPVLILDVTEEEAKKLLLTHDPIAALAESNEADLQGLLDSLSFDSEAINEMLTNLAREADRTTDNKGDLLDFPIFDDDIETQYKCPSCAYEWSGSAK